MLIHTILRCFPTYLKLKIFILSYGRKNESFQQIVWPPLKKSHNIAPISISIVIFCNFGNFPSLLCSIGAIIEDNQECTEFRIWEFTFSSSTQLLLVKHNYFVWCIFVHIFTYFTYLCISSLLQLHQRCNLRV